MLMLRFNANAVFGHCAARLFEKLRTMEPDRQMILVYFMYIVRSLRAPGPAS